MMCRLEDHRRTIQQQSSRWTLVRIGKLHFGFHGLLGILSIVLTAAGAQQQHSLLTSTWWWWLLVVSSQMSNAILVSHASQLLSQVPPYTQIVSGIVAPHKEAFQRTIAAMNYLIARVVVGLVVVVVQLPINNPTILYYTTLVVLLWRWWPLVPSRCNLDNGNTWIFVLPIFGGVTGDLWQYMVWNDCITISQLLLVQLLGLVLAFGFTLAFRNYIPMPIVYLVAALGVWRIIQEGIVTIKAS